MGRGFITFMKNPYYREQYENAPSRRVKQYLELEWDSNPFVAGIRYDDSRQCERIRKLKLKKSDVMYLAQYAVGGPEKAAFKKWLARFDKP